ATELQSDSLPLVSSKAKRFLRVISGRGFISVAVGNESLKQCATGVADFDIQEIIRRCDSLLRTAIEPESQISRGRHRDRDCLVSLSRHIVVHTEINVAGLAVRIVAIAG